MTATGPVAVADIARRLAAHLRDHQSSRDAVTDDPEVWDDVRDHQQHVRQQAWLRGLTEANHADYLGWLIADLDDDQRPRILFRFVEQLFESERKMLNLIIAGTTGGGKTAAAIATGTEAVRRGLLAQFVQHGTYLGWLRPDGAPYGMTASQVFHRHVGASLLILDDFGADVDRTRAASEFVQDATNDLLGARVADGKPTIVTTNLTSTEIKNVYGERVLSRLGTKAYVIELRTKDRRQPVSWG